jgi:hypothetical protein
MRGCLRGLIGYADRFIVIGITLSFFPIWDFIQKAVNPQEQRYCLGIINAALVVFSAFTLVCFAVSFGMVIMSERDQLVRAVPIWIFDGYALVLAGAFMCSLAYTIKMEVVKRRGSEK